ncbi:hypothetical protein [Streptomyces beijiangensis]|uniref:Uncharacterized protein n=1 Tax=Streptomyces beijiangensis TaxID=163361 RepID=A0A939F904_9ACTN|nr:hypothetical protein [Streptomyces beijiangensis]MBO0514138.1 hypothetical protein [Streptomyces beijiangensis]
MGRVLRGEWRRVVVDSVREARRRGVPGVSVALFAALAVIVVHGLVQTVAGAEAVRLTGEVRADLPLGQVLLRTPVSLFIAAPELPVWPGLPKLFLAFALAELTLGRTRTLLIAYGTSLAGTLGARVMIALGPDRLGLPPEMAHVLDTGPSAAVVGLFTYVAVVLRAPVLFAVTGGIVVVQSLLKPNLAGREHLIAVSVAIVLAVVRRQRQSAAIKWAADQRGCPSATHSLFWESSSLRGSTEPDAGSAHPSGGGPRARGGGRRMAGRRAARRVGGEDRVPGAR